MAQAKLVEGPHVLHTGVDGKPCAGITVETLTPKPGRMVRWKVNTFSLNANSADEWAAFLGISVEDVDGLRIACAKLEEGH